MIHRDTPTQAAERQRMVESKIIMLERAIANLGMEYDSRTTTLARREEIVQQIKRKRLTLATLRAAVR